MGFVGIKTLDWDLGSTSTSSYKLKCQAPKQLLVFLLNLHVFLYINISIDMIYVFYNN